MCLSIFYHRNDWKFDEDITLLQESLNTPKKWAIISKKFYGRTQHNVKNRFFFLMCRELNLKREKCRELIRRKNVASMVLMVLQGLKPQNSREIIVFSEEILEENIESDDGSLEDAAEILFGNGKFEDYEEFLGLNELLMDIV